MDRIFEGDMTADLDARIKDCLCACFPPDRAVFSVTRAWHGTFPAWSLVEEEGGRVIGQIGIVLREIRAGGIPVMVAGIQNVAVLPDARGTGLGRRLMEAAMDAAAADGVAFGLLFCVPKLGPYYGAQGWKVNPVEARMDFEGRLAVPIPGKNICMVRELAGPVFPSGDIDLRGADW